MTLQFRWPRLALALLLVALTHTALAQTKLLRFPDVHEDRVVFVYGGDLWTASVDGGSATRLTSHPGLELFPRFSPDGSKIAFTGQYDGDEQVYVVSSNGGEVRQLTWYPARGPLPPRWGYDNQVMGWSPDGSSVLFRSHRDGWDSSDSRLYTVPVDGGMPETLPMPVSGAGVFAGDTGKVFYSPLFRDFRTWKRYDGGWAQSLWLFDLEAGDARQATTHRRTDRDPMWIGDHGYFVSDEDDKLNLYRFDPETDEITQLTFHEDWDVRWASSDGRSRIVYEFNGGLRVFDVASGQDQGIEITVPADRINRRARRVDASDDITGAGISPTGSRVLFTARGDIYTAPVENGLTRNLTHRSTGHDREADWSPDGNRIAFVSDVGGEEELYVMAADGTGQPEAITSGNENRFYRPLWSPTGEHIALSDKDGRIYVIRADGRGELMEVGRDESWRYRDYAWSPDGAFLAFSLAEPSNLRALHIHDLSGGRTHRITDGMYAEHTPAFSPDGQYLYFLGDREFTPQISQREWNYAVNRAGGIFGLTLTTSGENPLAPRDDPEPGVNGNDNNNDNGGSDNDEVQTRIDFDGLAGRVFRVPVEPGNYGRLSAVDGALLYAEVGAFYYGRAPETRPKLQRYKLEDRKAETLVDEISDYAVSADGKKVLVAAQGGSYRVYELARDGQDPKSVSTSGLVTEVNPAEEWATIFHEVWRRYRDHFYVENMHGYDWDALRTQYEPWLEHVAHRADLNYLLGEMIGELNVSHAYVEGGDLGLPDRHPVALLGARFELDESNNRYRFSRILRGQNDEERYRAPLTELHAQVTEGEYLLAINGRTVTGEDNPWRMLRLPEGQPVQLTVGQSPDPDEGRTILVDPVSSEQPLLYHEWVAENHRRVTEATNGRVGYLHIPDMGPNGIREFIKWFYGQIRKDGLVIDVRGNGGGNVSQMIIERLARKPLALGYSRTQPGATTYPYQAFNGHLVALLSETSASDGDIFPYQFRNAGLGPLIGKRSWGGVVGITGHGPLLDGGNTFVPEFGFADTDGNYIIEGEGVAPDIEVDNHPASVIAGEDRQLDRAIREVMDRIEAEPPELPEAQAAPVK